MQIERRALYNSLRMNWLLDPTIPVENWQVEDYRQLSLEELFELLKKQSIVLDRSRFLAHAENFDTPEELAEYLTGENQEVIIQDQIYLTVFELWRRVVPEKPCLSVFCDELDYLINLYDQGEIDRLELIQDALANLQGILDENTDQGGSPHEIFEIVSSGCANDIEEFLYDFIAEQIDTENFSYASDLLEDFESYLKKTKWFTFLKARILFVSDLEAANVLLKQLVKEGVKDNDLEFDFELLSFLVQAGNHELFLKLVKHSLSFLQDEQDFADLLVICADFFHYLDDEKREKLILNLIEKRSQGGSSERISPKDRDRAYLVEIIENSSI